jgi:hypothetical protein
MMLILPGARRQKRVSERSIWQRPMHAFAALSMQFAAKASDFSKPTGVRHVYSHGRELMRTGSCA